MNWLHWVMLVSMGLMTFLILIQTRGADLGAGLGSSGEINTERRGTDKTIYQLTIILAVIFNLSLVFSVISYILMSFRLAKLRFRRTFKRRGR
ncbi:MAG: preprotein translocase subunit SecG, partial [Candidatus Saccharimonadales bacterium]